MSSAMQIGMVGLGRMGASMSERLRRAGHTVQFGDHPVATPDAGG